MQITYTTTLEDYVAFNRHVTWKSAVMWEVVLLCWLVVPAIAVACAAVLVMTEDSWAVAMIVAGIGLAYAVVFPPICRIWVDGLVRAFAKGLGTRGMIGRITLILTEESLVEITETTRSEVRWQDIKGVEVTRKHTFIFITGLSAAILPRHGCGSDKDYDAAREFALAQFVHAREQAAAAGRPRE